VRFGLASDSIYQHRCGLCELSGLFNHLVGIAYTTEQSVSHRQYSVYSFLLGLRCLKIKFAETLSLTCNLNLFISKLKARKNDSLKGKNLAKRQNLKKKNIFISFYRKSIKFLLISVMQNSRLLCNTHESYATLTRVMQNSRELCNTHKNYAKLTIVMQHSHVMQHSSLFKLYALWNWISHEYFQRQSDALHIFINM
jgi:hypothetical protein